MYPEVSTPIRPPPIAGFLNPPPPEDVLYLRFKSAWIPLRTRDGRQWSGGAPDPYAKLLVNGRELFRTPVQAHTHEPTWPESPKANYRVVPGSRVAVQLWDDTTFQQYPICAKDVEDLHSAATLGALEVVCDMGAKISLVVEPAHARFGVGMWYELRSETVYITRVLRLSPAGRADLVAGQRILRVEEQDVSNLDEAQIRSLINANLRNGFVITVLEPNGKTRTARLKEGPIYPLAKEDVPLD